MVQRIFSILLVPVQVDVEEIEDGGIAEPDPGVGDKVQAAAEAVAVAEQPERELHSFEIDSAQVPPCTQSASSGTVCDVVKIGLQMLMSPALTFTQVRKAVQRSGGNREHLPTYVGLQL